MYAFWCRIHLWFRLMGGLQAKSMTSQRNRAATRWRICVTMATLWQQQDGGYALLWKRFLHLQQYSHRLNLFLSPGERTRYPLDKNLSGTLGRSGHSYKTVAFVSEGTRNQDSPADQPSVCCTYGLSNRSSYKKKLSIYDLNCLYILNNVSSW